MEDKIYKTLFALIRLAILGDGGSKENGHCAEGDTKPCFASERGDGASAGEIAGGEVFGLRDAVISLLNEPKAFSRIATLAKKHDCLHLVASGLKRLGLLSGEEASALGDGASKRLENEIFMAVYRYQRLNFDLGEVCRELSMAGIPFMPLKGSVLRRYYPEQWMRTSCDIDVLVKKGDVEAAVKRLEGSLGYTVGERATHDVALHTPAGNHVELHFDLVEEGSANNAIKILSEVWENSRPKEEDPYHYEMTDDLFYFYHIAHMAKHFENGGCGIRPFIDLWILDKAVEGDTAAREALLLKGGLLEFCNACRRLASFWIGGNEPDEIILALGNYIISGGVYGSSQNRVAISQRKKGGRFGYLMSRIFAPRAKLKRYYPVLEKHPWLLPFMQVRRWFMLLRPDIRKMAKAELRANKKIESDVALEMKDLLDKIGLK